MMTRSGLLPLVIRLVGIGVSAPIAWQAVRYYRGQITIPGYDTFFATMAPPSVATAWAGPAGLLQALASVLQTTFGILLLLVIAVLLVGAFDRLAWRVLLGPAAYRDHRKSERDSADAQQPVKTVASEPAAPTKLGWFDAFIWSPVTLSIFSVVVLAIVAIAHKVEEVRSGLGLSWFSIGDTVIISLSATVWIAGAVGQLLQGFRHLTPGTAQ